MGLTSSNGMGDGSHSIFKFTLKLLIENDTFLAPSFKGMFGDDDIIFQDDNTSCYRKKA